MSPAVEISFECLPLRSLGRLDVPLDASPAFAEQCRRIKRAAEKHGLHNSYYLRDGRCVFRLTNDAQLGLLEFRFEGTVLTDAEDLKTLTADLHVELARETCDWLTEPVVAWFRQTVSHAVVVEFDRFIASGDLQKAVARLARLQAATDAQGGFLGMGL